MRSAWQERDRHKSGGSYTYTRRAGFTATAPLRARSTRPSGLSKKCLVDMVEKMWRCDWSNLSLVQWVLVRDLGIGDERMQHELQGQGRILRYLLAGHSLHPAVRRMFYCAGLCEAVPSACLPRPTPHPLQNCNLPPARWRGDAHALAARQARALQPSGQVHKPTTNRSAHRWITHQLLATDATPQVWRRLVGSATSPACTNAWASCCARCSLQRGALSHLRSGPSHSAESPHRFFTPLCCPMVRTGRGSVDKDHNDVRHDKAIRRRGPLGAVHVTPSMTRRRASSQSQRTRNVK